MKELNYFIKDINNKDNAFWFRFLEDINHNKFVLDEIIKDVIEYFNFDCNVCILESTSDNRTIKPIFKNRESIDTRLWTLLKKQILINACEKNQLQNEVITIKNEEGEEVKTNYFILPIKTKESNYYVIFDKLDSREKAKYAQAFECLHCIFLTCEKNDLLLKYTLIDNVTGCYNFNQFQKSLSVEIAKIDRVEDKDVTFSVIAMDISSLDRINEKFGYVCGNTVLKTVSSILKNKIRQTDDAYRIGGDEFAIINTYATKEICKDFILPRIQEDLKKKIHLVDNNYYIPKVNIAIVEYQKGLTRGQFEKKIKEALVLAKETKEIVIL